MHLGNHFWLWTLPYCMLTILSITEDFYDVSSFIINRYKQASPNIHLFSLQMIGNLEIESFERDWTFKNQEKNYHCLDWKDFIGKRYRILMYRPEVNDLWKRTTRPRASDQANDDVREGRFPLLFLSSSCGWTNNKIDTRHNNRRKRNTF